MRDDRPFAYAGVVLWIAAYNFQLLPSHFLALVPGMLYVHRAVSARQVLRRAAFAIGLMQFVSNVWLLPLTRYSAMGPVVYVAGPGWYTLWMTACLAGGELLRRRLGWPLWAVLPPLWVLKEFLMGIGELRLSFIRWCHTLTLWPALLQFTEWTGPGGAALWIVALNSLVFEAARAWLGGRRRSSAGAFAAALSLALIVPAGGVVRMRQVAAEMSLATRTCDTVALQPNIDLFLKNDPERVAENTESIVELARASAAGAQLVVMPESAVPGGVRHFLSRSARPELGAFGELAREGRYYLLAGSIYARIRGPGDFDFYNAALLVGPDGELRDWNAKASLLPFVEGLPYLPLLGIRRIPLGDGSLLGQLGGLTPGDLGRPLEFGSAARGSPAGGSLSPPPARRLGVILCSEEFYAEISRRLALNGAELFACMSEDTWYAGSRLIARYLSRMIVCRAIETRRCWVRSANTGISGFVTADGTFHDETAQWVRGAIRRALPLSTELTFYAQHGEWLALLSAVWLAGMLALCLARRGRAPRS